MVQLRLQDHPRGCGENEYHLLQAAFKRGSPPRMRGKPLSAFGQSSPLRITPADAGKTGSRSAAPQAARDHPRGCGENAVTLLRDCRRGGSPPRMRGKLPSSIASSILYRITPADAGKTGINTATSSIYWDHPRGCGENQPFAPFVGVYQGSPPRMRGKPIYRKAKKQLQRITPADAGKTMREIGAETYGLGSPPRMRGKLSCINYPYTTSRITPADAGKTLRYS